MRILQLILIVVVVGTSVAVGLAQDASSLKTLYGFTGQPDGSNPQASVVIGKNGVLYGTTCSGGTSNTGTVFKLVPPSSPGGVWTETVLHNFTGGTSDGANPQAGLVIGKNGVLYGTTYTGGTSDLGTVFNLAPPSSSGGAWTRTIVHDFAGGGSDGASPAAGVVIGKGGVLYGTTYAGGYLVGSLCLSGCGAVFQLRPPTSPGGVWTEALLPIRNAQSSQFLPRQV